MYSLTWSLLLKERICSKRSKFIPLRVSHTEKEGKIAELLPLQVTSLPFWLILFITGI